MEIPLRLIMTPMLTDKFAPDKGHPDICTCSYTLYNLAAAYEFRQYPSQDIATSMCWFEVCRALNPPTLLLSGTDNDQMEILDR